MCRQLSGESRCSVTVDWVHVLSLYMWWVMESLTFWTRSVRDNLWPPPLCRWALCCSAQERSRSPAQTHRRLNVSRSSQKQKLPHLNLKTPTASSTENMWINSLWTDTRQDVPVMFRLSCVSISWLQAPPHGFNKKYKSEYLIYKTNWSLSVHHPLNTTRWHMEPRLRAVVHHELIHYK